MQQQPRRRAILTQLQAIEIFRFRYECSLSMMVSSASVVAKRYGVNERTIRDIWKQRTWTHATSCLTEGADPMAERKMGRPVGSKDTRPRKQKLSVETSISYNFSQSKQMMTICASRPRSENQESPTESHQAQQDSEIQQLEDDREEEASIDDQLHAWADRGPQWITSASLPLLWDCEPAIC